jgi:hypothetical protein
VLAPDVIDLTEAPPDIDAPMVEAPPADATVEDTVLAPAAPPDIDAPPVIVPPEAPPELIPTTPARKRTAGVLAGAGLLTACVLVVWFVASGGDDTLPGDLGQPDEQITPTPEVSPSPQAGPRPEDRKEFEVLSAGLLLSGEEDISRRGIEIRREDAIRVAVDYANATDGIRLDALWRVNGKPYQRLTTVVSSKASRHVWGLPLPADGWPIGSHRIVLTANDSVAGSIDFAVRDTAL